MNASNQPTKTLLIFPEDFEVACGIFSLRYQELLQGFIDHVTICHLFLKMTDTLHSLASRVLSEYLYENGRLAELEPEETNRATCRKYLFRIKQLASSADCSPDIIRKASEEVMLDWQQEMVPVMVPSMNIKVGNDFSLRLSPGFFLQCELLHCKVQPVLQHFVNQISLPKVKVVTGLKIDNANAAMGFFLNLLSGPRKDIKLPGGHIHQKYMNRLADLEKKLYLERDARKQEEAYRKLHRAWFRELAKRRKKAMS